MTDGSSGMELISDDRRRVLKTLAAFGIASLACNPGFAAAAGTPKRGGRIRVGLENQSIADSLDPARANDTSAFCRMFMFYTGLTEFDPDFHTQNALAEKFESGDRKTWTVTLRSGVQFHNGKNLTADDVVFSLLRHKNPATASKVKSIADNIADVKAISPSRVEIILQEPNTDLPTLLAMPHFVIVPADTKDFSKGMGTGPFVCKQFIPAQRCIGTRNPNFWKPGRPYLDQIELVGVVDDTARVNGLLSGDLQLISPIPANDLDRLKQSGNARALESPSMLYSDLVMRQDMDPTRNQDFVEGVKYLFDRPRIVNTLLRGHGSIANDHPVPEWHPYFLKGLPQRAFDLDRAKFHFKKAGALKAVPEIIVPPSIEGGLDTAIMIQQSARAAGMAINVRRVPVDGYWSTYWLKFPMFYSSIVPRPTLDLLYTQFYRSSSPYNESGWKNAQFDQLLVQARQEQDEAKRKQIYGDMQTIIYQKNSLGIPAFINFIDARSSKLQGLKGSPSGRLMGYRFAEFAWLDQA